MPEIRAVHDAEQFRQYIDTYWRPGHVLAHDDAMFRFTYSTPWVDGRIFPGGISALGVYDHSEMLGFLGAIITPYPRPQSYWLALWHVRPELKGSGLGGQLLAEMQDRAESGGGWIGTFGAGPEALPVYLKRGYCVRAGRRWIYNGPEGGRMPACPLPLHTAESRPNESWMRYRYDDHPRYAYERRMGGVFRTEVNAWGRVTHVCWLTEGPAAVHDVVEVFTRESALAADRGQPYLMDAWGFDCPGAGWTLAPEDLPSVFHPVAARGNVTYAVGRPFLVSRVHKGDCDQDRPNEAALTAASFATA